MSGLVTKLKKYNELLYLYVGLFVIGLAIYGHNTFFDLTFTNLGKKSLFSTNTILQPNFFEFIQNKMWLSQIDLVGILHYPILILTISLALHITNVILILNIFKKYIIKKEIENYILISSTLFLLPIFSRVVGVNFGLNFLVSTFLGLISYEFHMRKEKKITYELIGLFLYLISLFFSSASIGLPLVLLLFELTLENSKNISKIFYLSLLQVTGLFLLFTLDLQYFGSQIILIKNLISLINNEIRLVLTLFVVASLCVYFLYRKNKDLSYIIFQTFIITTLTILMENLYTNFDNIIIFDEYLYFGGLSFFGHFLIFFLNQINLKSTLKYFIPVLVVFCLFSYYRSSVVQDQKYILLRYKKMKVSNYLTNLKLAEYYRDRNQVELSEYYIDENIKKRPKTEISYLKKFNYIENESEFKTFIKLILPNFRVLSSGIVAEMINKYLSFDKIIESETLHKELLANKSDLKENAEMLEKIEAKKGSVRIKGYYIMGVDEKNSKNYKEAIKYFKLVRRELSKLKKSTRHVDEQITELEKKIK